MVEIKMYDLQPRLNQLLFSNIVMNQLNRL